MTDRGFARMVLLVGTVLTVLAWQSYGPTDPRTITAMIIMALYVVWYFTGGVK